MQDIPYTNDVFQYLHRLSLPLSPFIRIPADLCVCLYVCVLYSKLTYLGEGYIWALSVSQSLLIDFNKICLD
jgi:hypothetical protein